MPDLGWLTKVDYVDIDTGEVLTKDFAKKYYTIIKTQKNGTEFNKQRTRAITTLTKFCRKRDRIQNTIW